MWNTIGAGNPLFQAFSPIPVQGSTNGDCIKVGAKIESTVERGNGIINWIEMDPGMSDRVLRRKTYAVCDFILPNGSFLLDRYFVSNEVHVFYQEQEMCHPDYPNCVTYFIRFKRRDAGKVQKALMEMYRQVDLFDRKGIYKRYIDFMTDHLMKVAETVKSR